MSFAAASGGVLLGSGCSSLAEDCENTLCLDESSQIPGSCIPASSGAPADSCGVFVSSSLGDDDAGLGTRDAPYETLQAAIDKGIGRPVYLCAEDIEGASVIVDDIFVFGGLDCQAGWSYVGGDRRSVLTSGPGEIPLSIGAGDGGATLTDLEIVAADGDAPGTSSIAVLAVEANVTFERSTLRAGNGAVGVGGESPTEIGPNDEGSDGVAGGSGTTGVASLPPGEGGMKLCGTLDVSGGTGGLESSDGGKGNPVLAGSGDGGDGGVRCDVGDPGAIGAAGSLGDPGTGIGQLDASGYSPGTSGAGGPGEPGQGGGGGGGVEDATGGGGSSGGCGGLGGGAAGGGGASIALASIDSMVVLKSSQLSSAEGGEGGEGGRGQPGGEAGIVGFGMGGSCAGGNGGDGGPGGSGGGGHGGVSAGVAFIGTAPTLDETDITTGDPGAGGNAPDADNDGEDGIACEVLSFDDEGCEA